MPNVTEIRCKQALNKISKSGLPQEWDLNLYRGCQHGCIYCFAIYSHEYLNPNSNYYEDLYVKTNIVQQLEKQLASPTWKRGTIAIAGVSDCYQPIEAKYKLMPEILKLMIKYKNPVAITTKSDLILRDYDLIDELSRITDVEVNASIVTMDNDVRRKIEPVGRNAKQKFSMLKEFSKTNATTNLLQMPIIPYITDSRENIEDLYAHAADAQVDSVIHGLLYLRGKTRGVFFDAIKREFPDLFVPLTKLYQKGGRTEYRRELYQMVGELRKKYRLQSWYSTLSKKTPTQEAPQKVDDGFQQLSLFEEDSPSHYTSSPIPTKKQLDQNRSTRQASKKVQPINLNPFVEIHMGEGNPAPTPTPTAIIQPLEAVRDEKQKRFYAMRQLARKGAGYKDHSEAFYEQAQFMKDFTDDYPTAIPFSSYFPYYQRMGYEQLRTYFTWRTHVRNGDILPTGASYAFLYIYELLNQIGMDDPEDGFHQLVCFWQNFRNHDSSLDEYVLGWLKDYHVYYSLPWRFQDFAEEYNLTSHYPEIFAYDSHKQDSFHLFASLSKYDIGKSVFYTDEHRVMIQDCFHYLLQQLRAPFKDTDQAFEDFIFYPLTEQTNWTPFSRALFYPKHPQEDRKVKLSEREIYRCKDGTWEYTGTRLTDSGRHLISYLLKEVEVSLRQTVKFKYKLTANSKDCDEKTLTALEEVGIQFPDFIQNAVTEFYRQMTHKEIKVDVSNLGRIRVEALETQEKLIVPEEEVKVTKVEKTVIEAPLVTTSTTDPWQPFKTSLTDIERETLKRLLAGNSVQPFAKEKMIMLEVLVDGINDKAMDTIGDTLLEIDDDVVVHEEYMVELKDCLS